MGKINKYFAASNEDLCLYIQQGQEEALEAMLCKNRPFIASVAHEILKKRSSPCVTFEELINEGVIAVFEAAMHFDRQRGSGFLTFAGRVIRNKMHDLLDLYSDSQNHLPQEYAPEAEPCLDEHLDIRQSVEAYVLRKIMLEEVRSSFLTLPARHQMILAYKFGIDLHLHPLDTIGREYSDEVVACYFASKVSLIRKNVKEGYKMLHQRLYGEYPAQVQCPAGSEIS